MEAGRNAEAVRVFDELDGAGDVDEVSRALAEVCRGEIELQLTSTAATVDRFHRQAQAAIELFAAHDDAQALVRACWLSYLTSMTVGRSGAAREAIDRLGILAERLSHPLAGRLPGMLAMNLAWGPTPVPEALEGTSELLESVRDDPAAEPFVLGGHAYLLAQAGDIDGARRALDRMREIAERLGQRVVLWGVVGTERRPLRVARGRPGARRAGAATLLSRAARGGQPRVLVDARRATRALAGRPRAARRRRRPTRRRRATRPARPTCSRRSSGGARSPGRSPSRATRRRRSISSTRPSRLAGTTEWPNVIADALLDRARVVRHDRLRAGRCATRTSSGPERYTWPRRTRPATRRPRSSRQARGRAGKPRQERGGAR